MTLSYDAAARQYTLQNEQRVRQFGPSELLMETSVPDLYPRVEYQRVTSSDADFLVFFKSPNASPPLTFAHSGHGAWQHNDPMPGGTRVRLDYFTFGEPTSVQAMPTSGTATYRFVGSGNYAREDSLFVTSVVHNLAVDFSAGTFSGSVIISGREFFEGGFGGLTSFVIAGTIAGNAAGGPLTFTSPTWAGTFRLQFYGPQAQELGVVFTASGVNASQTGAFIGARQ